MPSNPSVSVVIPTYNCAALLPGAIASVRAQKWRDLEIIVVDDGSTDDTAEVLKGLAAGDMRWIRRCPHYPGRGAATGVGRSDRRSAPREDR